ncbi:MAG: hypothetical protein ACKOQW_00410 [Phycisphaerales bacterium]
MHAAWLTGPPPVPSRTTIGSRNGPGSARASHAQCMVVVAGDHVTDGSIDGAWRSGSDAAAAALRMVSR